MTVDRRDMPGNPDTFHRWDSKSLNMQCSIIDHVLIENGQRGGAKVSSTGLDLHDHSIIVGWVEAPLGKTRVKEMKGTKLATLRPADKGATKKFEKAWGRIQDDKIKKMSMEEIIMENRRIVEKIGANRNNKRNPNGWSPISRLVSLRISVHGTARRMKDKLTYEKVMKERVEELKRSEESLTLNEDEVGWLRDNGLNEKPIEWQEWKMLYGGASHNEDHMNRLRKLNSGRRRRELRILHNTRMYRIQADADAGRIGGVIREIINRKGGYKMQAIVDEGVCTKEPKEVTNIATKHFTEWFWRSDEDKQRDILLTGIMKEGDGKAFEEAAREMKMPVKAIESVWKGFKKKELGGEGRKEA